MGEFAEYSNGYFRDENLEERAAAAIRTIRRKEETKQAALEAKRQAHWRNRAARFLRRLADRLQV